MKQGKLFPDIEGEIRTETEVKDESVDGDIDLVKDVQVSSEKAMPFLLPPRDYDLQDSPGDIQYTNEGFKYLVQEEMPVEEQKPSISRKSSSSSSSSSEGETPKETEVVEEVSLVKSDVAVEERSPVMSEDFEKEELKDVTPVIKVADQDESVISGNMNIDESVRLENVVRSRGDVSEIHLEKQSQMNSSTVMLQPDVVEDVKTEDEKEKEREEANEEVPGFERQNERKTPSRYQIIIERGLKGEIEGQGFEEEILKDLPESSVDSDSEIIEAQKMKSDDNREDAASTQDESRTAEGTNVDSISPTSALDEENVVNVVSVEVKEGPLRDDDAEGLSRDDDTERPSRDYSTEGPSRDDDTEGPSPDDNTEGPSQDDDTVPPHRDILADSPEKKDISALATSEKDRSSFMEAFSKDPSFGSWFSGETTILEKDRGDEEAEEIASKVIILVLKAYAILPRYC